MSETLLGKESETVVVNGKPYFIKPPTIKQIAGIGYSLSESGETDILSAMRDVGSVCKALSWAVRGDESLSEEFEKASFSEVVSALEVSIGKIGIEDFQRLSGLRRSVLRLIANQK